MFFGISNSYRIYINAVFLVPTALHNSNNQIKHTAKKIGYNENLMENFFKIYLSFGFLRYVWYQNICLLLIDFGGTVKFIITVSLVVFYTEVLPWKLTKNK